ncbi:MAG TPA: hypothetical protein DEO70_02865 [Bacteroidales bacterium]|nr:MAG: hypothetical protein A2X11_14265 [Bacteroidetes bacterium GWE2_42_24]OFY30020.1 MAG: hypothetical protein A2X09_14415 [Bacteroidetes bacterium GWF2_43_11]HBZ65751.1 hypothetical protein [Bacteroidales bacterium]
MIKVDKNKVETRVCQGDIIANVEFVEYAIEKSGQIEISKIIFPYVYVLSQDCDLEQEYSSRTNANSQNQDKHLISVIVAPLYNLEQVYDGIHLEDIGLKMQTISRNTDKTENKILRQNNNPRYHYLEFSNEVSIPNSVIDFKHYFTVNNNLLLDKKKKCFVCKVSELYRENISHRFSFFLSRIGLP